MNQKPSTLVELLRLRALQQPEHPIYTFLLDGEAEESRLTHAELERQARITAARLQQMGMTGERVLLLYPPGLEFITAFFGCLYAGAVAVPAYPPRPNRSLLRIQAIVADAEAKAALTTARILSRIENDDAQVPELMKLAWLATDDLAGSEDEWRQQDGEPDALAFLQYTSGSTGKPKGVMLTHRNLLHNAELVRQAMGHTPQDRYVSWLPTFHDMGFMAGILQPLHANISAVLMSPAAFLQNPARWLQAVSRFKATTSGGPNFAYDLCVRRARPEQLEGIDLSSWSVAFNGAEPVRDETMKNFAEAFAPYNFRREAFYPCYGLAEATLMVSGGKKSTAYVVKRVEVKALENNRVVEASASDADERTLVSCGKALMGQEVFAVDPERLTECAPSEVGEIWVSGGSVARGYWGRPEETEHTFGARLAGQGGTKFLRTGDLGFLQDGELFITGRLKDLLIIRGLNHYPQDIELTAERSHPALRPGCGAAFSVNVAGEERLVIVQEVDARQPHRPEDVIDHVRQAVAEEHELQVYGVVLIKPATIPKTSSGKIQRHACKNGFLTRSLDELARSLTDDSYETAEIKNLSRAELLRLPPEDRLPALESYLQEQAAGVLRVPSAALNSSQSLTAAGLDSLMSTELKYRLETSLGIVVPQVMFLQDSSLRQLATPLLRLLEEPSASEAPAERAVETLTEHPLSPMQQAIWFLCELAPESAAYNVAFAASAAGKIDVEALRRAFQSLVERHASLRTTFHVRDGQPVQRIHDSTRVHYEVNEASVWDEQELHQRLLEEANRTFDLERGPIFRVNLYRRPTTGHVLLVTTHHLVADGWSFWVLLDDLRTFYAAEKAGAQPSLPSLTKRYTDFVHWSSHMLTQPEGERLWSYWQSKLSGELPLLDLPTSKPRPLVQTYPGASYHFTITPELTGLLKELAKQEQATLYMTVLAAFQVLLRRYTGQEDILVGSPISGRSRATFEGIVGCFFNVVVLRANLSGNPSFRSFLRQVRQTVLGALEHQDYPSHWLAEQLHTARDPSRPPLFQTTFILQKPHRLQEVFTRTAGSNGDGQPHDLPLKLFPLERRYARAELELEMIELDGALSAWFHYNTDLFDAHTIARMAGHFLNLLDEVASHPQKRVLHLSLLTDAERQQLLEGWSNAGANFVVRQTVQTLFEEQAERTPGKVAAVYDDSSLTFGELDEQANQLANLIMELKRG